jgi:hypothetical protein
MTQSERLAVDAIAMAGCALVAAFGIAACGGKLAPAEIQDDYDAAPESEAATETPDTEAGPEGGCGPLDPELACGSDHCGNAVSPVCRPALWVCPPIPPDCSNDGSAGDASPGPVGFACGSGSCPPGTFCQDPVGTIPGACIPFPSECKRTPSTPSETCACLERRAAQDKVCRPNRYLCPYPTSDLSALHVGCAAE